MYGSFTEFTQAKSLHPKQLPSMAARAVKMMMQSCEVCSKRSAEGGGKVSERR